MVMRTLFLLSFSLATSPAICFPGEQQALDAVQFDMVLGRLVATSSLYHQTKQTSVTNADGDIREALTMNVNQGVADVQYEMNQGPSVWTIDVVQGREVTIEKQSGHDQFVRLHQPRRGNITLVVRDGGQESHYAEVSLWHLAMTYPDACREHLVPMCDLLRPGMQLETALQKVETELVHLAESENVIDRVQVSALVRKMDSNRFIERQAADRRLRQIGLAAFPYLTQLNERHLGSEQRRRIERIVDDITWQRSDSPSRVAQWLVNDASIWLALSKRDDRFTREVALKHLVRLGAQ